MRARLQHFLLAGRVARIDKPRTEEAGGVWVSGYEERAPTSEADVATVAPGGCFGDALLQPVYANFAASISPIECG